MADSLPIYRIIRFSMTSPSEQIREDLTLEEAQAHCQRDDTHGPGWFDGYDTMAGYSDDDSDDDDPLSVFNGDAERDSLTVSRIICSNDSLEA